MLMWATGLRGCQRRIHGKDSLESLQEGRLASYAALPSLLSAPDAAYLDPQPTHHVDRRRSGHGQSEALRTTGWCHGQTIATTEASRQVVVVWCLFDRFGRRSLLFFLGDQWHICIENGVSVRCCALG